MSTPPICDNDICNHKAMFELVGMEGVFVCCTNHLPWAVRKATEGGLTASVKEFYVKKGSPDSTR